MGKGDILLMIDEVRKLLDAIEVELGIPIPDTDVHFSQVFRPKKIHFAKAVSTLNGGGVYRLSQLIGKTEKELLEFRNLGKTTVDYIKGELAHLGLTLMRK